MELKQDLTLCYAKCLLLLRDILKGGGNVANMLDQHLCIFGPSRGSSREEMIQKPGTLAKVPDGPKQLPGSSRIAIQVLPMTKTTKFIA